MVKKDGMILELLIIRPKVKTKTMNIIDTKHAMLRDFDSPFDINVDLYK